MLKKKKKTKKEKKKEKKKIIALIMYGPISILFHSYARLDGTYAHICLGRSAGFNVYHV